MIVEYLILIFFPGVNGILSKRCEISRQQTRDEMCKKLKNDKNDGT